MVAYRPYRLPKTLRLNGRNFNEIVISSHYEENHSSYMTDKKILEIVKQLEHKFFTPYRQGKLPDETEWQSFFWEPFFSENKAYRLVWYWKMNSPCLWVLHCFRRKKYE